ncbi:MAG TPA: sulfotransferase [Devosia sp.]|nr:sulfotransferase [Devosia sp.]
MPNPNSKVRADHMFKLLAGLARARKGILAYYLPLLETDDEIIRLGAVCQLLNLRTLPERQIDRVLDLCRYGAVKKKAFDFFQSEHHQELARQVAAIRTSNHDEVLTQLMEAQLDFDQERALEASIAVFRETGHLSDLSAIAIAADRVGGWKLSSEWNVRGAALTPLDPTYFLYLFHGLAEANQFDLVDTLAVLLNQAGLHPYLHGVYSANAALARGDVRGCVDRIAKLAPPSESAPRLLRSVTAHAKRLLGDAHERLGNYETSYKLYAEMNRLEQSPTVKAMSENSAISNGTYWQNLATAVPELPPYSRDDIVMLLGFPRSGTTLLENALDGHPDIEAYEELPTWDAAFAMARPQWHSRMSSTIDQVRRFVSARDIYFDQVDKRRKKKSARYVLDKYPMRTIHVALMAKLLPNQRYIFAIRHPFDVALSCFRQRFNPNTAMESFRTIKGTIELYDATMTQWFEYHSMKDPLVHYVKYDDVVTDFDSSIRRVLEFIGLPWDDNVHNFAEAAQDRVARTPSYQKVRRGLGIGVQTYWRNYGFLFQTPEAKPLYKWASFFGYETQ